VSYYSNPDEGWDSEYDDLDDESEELAERRRPVPKYPGPTVVNHRPVNDADAKQTILDLNHFEWDTVKVTGRFSRTPYKLEAKIDGRPHVIHLQGRRGTVLTWLRDQLDKKEAERG
jgi:hypothetical protein